MKILSIQSSVAYGHVGNSAAVFPLQRLGHEVWPVLTVHFSNHTGYGAWRGPLLARRRRPRGDRRHRRPRRARRGGRGAVRLPGRPGGRRDHPRHGRPGEGAQPGRGLLLRPGDGRRRARHVRAAGDPGVHARHRRAAGRHRHAQPLRARLPRRPRPRPRSTRSWTPSTTSARAARATCWSPASCTATCPRAASTCVAVSDEGAWAVETPLLPITPERLRRRHRRALPRPPAHDRLGGRGARPDDVVGLRDPRGRRSPPAPARSSWSPPRTRSPSRRRRSRYAGCAERRRRVHQGTRANPRFPSANTAREARAGPHPLDETDEAGQRRQSR